jgi:excisionase family DNA binding protein
MPKSNSATSAAPAVEQGAYKLSAACQYLGGVSEITVRRLIDRGLIKPCRGLRHILIPKTELDRFLAQ